jgi:hypothetical protein
VELPLEPAGALEVVVVVVEPLGEVVVVVVD